MATTVTPSLTSPRQPSNLTTVKTCGSCRKNIANQGCLQCFEFLCIACERERHIQASVAPHRPFWLLRCKACEQEPTITICQECEGAFCQDCDALIHHPDAERSHRPQRVDLFRFCFQDVEMVPAPNTSPVSSQQTVGRGGPEMIMNNVWSIEAIPDEPSATPKALRRSAVVLWDIRSCTFPSIDVTVQFTWQLRSYMQVIAESFDIIVYHNTLKLERILEQRLTEIGVIFKDSTRQQMAGHLMTDILTFALQKPHSPVIVITGQSVSLLDIFCRVRATGVSVGLLIDANDKHERPVDDLLRKELLFIEEATKILDGTARIPSAIKSLPEPAVDLTRPSSSTTSSPPSSSSSLQTRRSSAPFTTAEAKEAILQVLQEVPDQRLRLSLIPDAVKKKYQKLLQVRTYGYTNLKALLLTMPQVDLAWNSTKELIAEYRRSARHSSSRGGSR
eukprot:GILK01011253.1.p1 GENE.GILK01011253.1~~GILK01011253.1.p1  ORF type:complete len:461 (-),score=52.47 GILK01011253.1:23-1366(-)